MASLSGAAEVEVGFAEILRVCLPEELLELLTPLVGAAAAALAAAAVPVVAAVIAMCVAAAVGRGADCSGAQ